MHIQWTGEMAFWIFILGAIFAVGLMWYGVNKDNKKKS